ncbi:hypothetical protein EUGRSUZ_D01447 [Eucalyptus grandis]|uniref:ADP-ribosyl cyclase/cyclic ADP-ribose hydrolase n=3 Tax=Eucalyptus grandis TaxID=71139 RepID=A0A059CF61_EUCGR|nr:hypothetical protein EUGRSUZ_D01447 [Eucalyptus grandis]KAK3433563.1 hypothetical protein EUGRSUZ_D01447 [Eucalyptus grandis]
MYGLRTVLLPALFVCAYVFLPQKMYGLQAVLLLALFVCAYIFLQQKKGTASRTYDVFLSFKGEDTRGGFTDHLYNGLIAAGFHVFKDDNTLPVGEEIGQELVEAIMNCRIAIPIISKNYAQSKWCLRELTKIMNCHIEQKKRVFPVFYKVNLLDLHDPGSHFAADLSKHDATCHEESAKWRKAMTFVAWVRGWTSQTIANGRDAELVKMVVERVSSELQTMWIERLPIFPMLMSNYYIRSAYGCFSEKKRGEVFLAFHGRDTRLGFAACLYSSLVGAGIRVLKDDHPYLIDELAEMVDCKRQKGQKILPIFYKVKPSDVRNISGSFGEYIRQHKENIQPLDKIFGEYMRQHKENIQPLDEIGKDKDRKMSKQALVEIGKYKDRKRWKQALVEIGKYKGLESEKIANGNEGELLKRVVEEVLMLLKNPQKLDPS